MADFAFHLIFGVLNHLQCLLLFAFWSLLLGELLLPVPSTPKCCWFLLLSLEDSDSHFPLLCKPPKPGCVGQEVSNSGEAKPKPKCREVPVPTTTWRTPYLMDVHSCARTYSTVPGLLNLDIYEKFTNF